MEIKRKIRVDREPKVFKKTKLETTYHYVPILGEVLGFWRKEPPQMIGQNIEIHLQHSVTYFDRLYLNGVEINISKYKDEQVEEVK